MMKRNISNLKTNTKIYFGFTDTFHYDKQNLSSDELLLYFKLANLAYDHILIASAYFWQNPELDLLLPHLKKSMERNDVLPTIRHRNVTRDILEYYQIRVDETKEYLNKPGFSELSILSTEIAQSKHYKTVEELKAIGSFVYRDSGSVEEKFKLLFRFELQDQNNPHSLLNILNIYSPKFSKKLINHIIAEIRSLLYIQHFSRSIIASKIISLKLPENLQQLLIERVSFLYLSANAVIVNTLRHFFFIV